MENKVAKVTSFGQVVGSLQAIKDRLHVGPLAIAVASNNDEWRFYSEGVMDGSQVEGGCNPEALDHAVTLVGYSDETESTVAEVVEMNKVCTFIWSVTGPSYNCHFEEDIVTT